MEIPYQERQQLDFIRGLCLGQIETVQFLLAMVSKAIQSTMDHLREHPEMVQMVLS